MCPALYVVGSTKPHNNRLQRSIVLMEGTFLFMISWHHYFAGQESASSWAGVPRAVHVILNIFVFLYLIAKCHLLVLQRASLQYQTLIDVGDS